MNKRATQAEMESALNGASAQVKRMAQAAYEALLQKIGGGLDPRSATQEVLKPFTGEFYQLVSDELSAIKGQAIGIASVKDLPVSGFPLSQNLYAKAVETSTIVAEIVRQHAAGFQSASELSMSIFEGYGFNISEPINLAPGMAQLPKYLRDVIRDPTIKGALNDAIAQADNLKTPALRAAYLDALKAIEGGAGNKLLAKRLDVAFNERMRYYANRIAQTELARVWADERARTIMATKEIEYVQIRMSITHPRADICDLWSKQDAFGKGAGVYPKGAAPQPPFHPFCRCHAVPRIDIPVGAQAKPKTDPERKWLLGQSKAMGAQVMGSYAKRATVMNGEKSVVEVLNSGIDQAYHFKTLGQFLEPLTVDMENQVKEMLAQLAQVQGNWELERSVAKIEQTLAANAQAADQAYFDEALSGKLGKWFADAAKQYDVGVLPGKKDLDTLAAVMKQEHVDAGLAGWYKKAMIEGKTPKQTWVDAFNNMPGAKQQQITHSIQIGLEAKAAEKVAQELAAQAAKGPVPAATATADKTLVMQDVSKWKQIGAQAGSNEGGLFKAPNGDKFYLKFPADANIAKNEVLAAHLYRLAGIDVPELQLITRGKQLGIASRYIEGLTTGTPTTLAKAAGAMDGFVTDAWLANWDVVGLGLDNLKLQAGTAWRVDVGGSLLYRAQGAAKGADFGLKVKELETLLNTATNPKTAAVFGKITADELATGAARVLFVQPQEIMAAVRAYGPGSIVEQNKLIDTLILRRQHIATKFPSVAARVEQMFADARAAALPKVQASLVQVDAKIVEAAKGIASRTATGAALEAKDIQRVNDAVSLWKTFQQANAPILNSGISKALAAEYEPWIAKLTEAIKSGVGNVGKWETGALFKGTALDASAIEAAAVKPAFNPARFGVVKSIDVTTDELMAINKGRLNGFSIKTDLDEIEDHDVLIWYETNAQGQQVTRAIFKARGAGMDAVNQAAKQGSRVDANFYMKRVINGVATETKTVVDTWGKAYERKMAGASVRLFGEDASYFSLRGRVEISVVGRGADAVKQIYQAIGEIGINSARTAAVSMEETYLRQIANHMNQSVALRPASAINDSAARVEWMRAKVSELAGVRDITKLQDYNPSGVRQAFGDGRTYNYRPDLTGKAWNDFTSQYVLIHRNTGSMSMPDLIDAILNGGGNMTASTEKLRRGIKLSGMSPDMDLETGGGSFFFTRIRAASDTAPGSRTFVFDSKLLARTDSISYEGDMYGRTTGNTIEVHRKTGIAQWSGVAYNGTNETIFKNSISIFDGLKYINVKDAAEKKAIIDIFNRHGYTAMPDGRALNDVIRIKK